MDLIALPQLGWTTSAWTWVWPVLVTSLYVCAAVLLHRWLTPRLRLWVGRSRNTWDDIVLNAAGWPLLLLLFLGGIALLISLWPVRFTTQEFVLRITKITFLLLIVSFAHQFLNHWFRASQPGSWLRITLLRKLILFSMYSVLVMMILGIFGYQISALITTLGISSLAVALAAQQILGNFFAGLQLSIDRPLEIGQSVTLENGMEGEVITIGWMKTWLRAPDGSRVLVPNAKLTGFIIRNYSLGQRGPAVQVKLPIAAGQDLARAEAIVRAAAHAVAAPLSAQHPKMEPLVQFTEITPTAAILTVTLYALDYKTAWQTRSEFIKQAGSELAQAEIRIA